MQTAATRQEAPRKTVLVVDDSREIRSIVRLLFLMEGYDICEEAGNGQEAIKIAALIYKTD